MVFNLYFVKRQLYWSALLRNRDKEKAAFFEHVWHGGHCLCQPCLTCTILLHHHYHPILQMHEEWEKGSHVCRAAFAPRTACLQKLVLSGGLYCTPHSSPVPWGQDYEQEPHDCTEAPFLDSVQLLLSMTPKLQPEDTCLTSPNPTLRVQPLCLYQYYSSALSSFCTLSYLCYRS